MRTTDAWKEVLRNAIRKAMREKDKDALAVSRETLAAIDNAEAREIDAAPAAQDGPIAGAVAGAGGGEVPRRLLDPEEALAVIRNEIDEREKAARVYADLGRNDEAERLRRQASFLSSL